MNGAAPEPWIVIEALRSGNVSPLRISLDGTAWTSTAAAAGQPLSSNARYRVTLTTGQFDAAELDRVELRHVVP